MRKSLRIIASAVVPVLGVSAAIAVMQSAGGLFPPALAWSAWPAWVIFAALVHAFTAFGFHAAGRFGDGPQPGGPAASAHQA